MQPSNQWRNLGDAPLECNRCATISGGNVQVPPAPRLGPGQQGGTICLCAAVERPGHTGNRPRIPQLSSGRQNGKNNGIRPCRWGRRRGGRGRGNLPSPVELVELVPSSPTRATPPCGVPPTPVSFRMRRTSWSSSQRRLAEGQLDPRHGTVILDDPDAIVDGRPFAHYVLLRHPGLGPRRRPGPPPAAGGGGPPAPRRRRLAARLRAVRRGLPGRPARPRHRHTRASAGTPTTSPVPISTSGPAWPSPSTSTPPRRPTASCGCCPAATSAAPKASLPDSNGSPVRSPSTRSGATSLFHHADLWHAAARATADGRHAVRRHLRGSWHGGRPARDRPRHRRLRQERPPLIHRGRVGLFDRGPVGRSGRC